MDDERSRQDEEAAQRGEDRRQDAAAHYERAQAGGSVERERAALQTLDLQTERNRIDSLERRLARVEEELAALKSKRRDNTV